MGKPHQRFTDEFKLRAVERMQTADSISELAKELGIRRNLLYKWEAKSRGGGKWRPHKIEPRRQSETEQALLGEIRQLREALGNAGRRLIFARAPCKK